MNLISGTYHSYERREYTFMVLQKYLIIYCWLQSSLVHPHDEDQENVWSQNPKVQIHSNFSMKEMN